jgi:hypothetical protein
MGRGKEKANRSDGGLHKNKRKVGRWSGLGPEGVKKLKTFLFSTILNSK